MTKREKKLLTHLIKMSHAVSHPLNLWGENTYHAAESFVDENYGEKWLDCMHDADKFEELCSDGPLALLPTKQFN